MRLATFFLAAACITANAVAGPSTAAISDFAGLFVETSVAQQQRLCAARIPETAAPWKTDLQRWRTANAEPLRELREVGQAVHRATAQRALDAPSSVSLDEREGQFAMYSGFMMLAASQPAMELAGANDVQAAERCQNWRAAIAPNGALELGLPHAIEGAKRLLQSLQSAGR